VTYSSATGAAPSSAAKARLLALKDLEGGRDAVAILSRGHVQARANAWRARVAPH
jgi:hypothetical protein